MKHFNDHDRRNNPTRAYQLWLILIGLAMRRETVTYKSLAKQIAIGVEIALGEPLKHIACWCKQNQLSALTVLVVKEEKGVPGDWLVVQNVDAEREAVFNTDWYSIIPPTPEELDAAFKNCS